MKLYDNCCHSTDSSSLITTPQLHRHIAHELHLHSDSLTLADAQTQLVRGEREQGELGTDLSCLQPSRFQKEMHTS